MFNALCCQNVGCAYLSTGIIMGDIIKNARIMWLSQLQNKSINVQYTHRSEDFLQLIVINITISINVNLLKGAHQVIFCCRLFSSTDVHKLIKCYRLWKKIIKMNITSHHIDHSPVTANVSTGVTLNSSHPYIIQGGFMTRIILKMFTPHGVEIGEWGWPIFILQCIYLFQDTRNNLFKYAFQEPFSKEIINKYAASWSYLSWTPRAHQ